MAKVREEIIVDTTVTNAEKSVKQIDAVADATKDAQEESENYADTLKDTAGDAEIFGVSINGISGAMRSSVGAVKASIKSLGGFKTALIATGVGAFVVLLGSLVAWLQRSQEGMDFMTDAMSALGAVVDTIIGTITQLGEALVKVFKGDISGAVDTFTEAITGFGDRVIESTTAVWDLNGAMRALEEDTAKATSSLAFNEFQMSKNKRVAEDVTKDIGVRIEAEKEVIRLQNENLAINQDLADQNLALVQGEVNLARAQEEGREANRLEKQAIADASAETFKVRGENEEAQIESQNKLNELEAIQNEQRNKYTQDEVKSSVVKNDLKGHEVDTVRKSNQLILDSDLDRSEQEIQIAKDTAKVKEDIARQNAEIEHGLRMDLLSASIELAGQDTAIGKALAISEATYNTWKAVTVALDATTMVQRTLGVAYALATGLNAVKQIQSTPIPKVQVVDTPFALGGILNGPSHQNGGVWVNAEGGEGILTKRAMQIPWVREQASQLNQMGGGVKFQAGGIVPDTNALAFNNLSQAISEARTVLVTEDLRAVQNNTLVSESISTL